MKKNTLALLAGILLACCASVAATTYVTGKMILDGTITSDDIATGTITTADLAAGAVTSSKIADGTLESDDFADGAIDAAKIDTDSLADVIVTESLAKYVGTAHAYVDTVLTGTTLIPFDDTIPQITEGDQYLQAAVAPDGSTSDHEIEVTLIVSASVAGHVTVALFETLDSPNAIAATAVKIENAGDMVPVHLVWRSNSFVSLGYPYLYTVRAGLSTAGTVTVNGVAGARKFGGVAHSSIVVREIVNG